MKTLFVSLLTILLCFTPKANANANDDDFLLFYVPLLAASSKTPIAPEPQIDGIGLMKKLGGRWFFETPSRVSDFVFETYFRFNPSTATNLGDGIFAMEGRSSITASFFSEWCDGGLISSYDEREGLYLVICDWGFPSTDLGTVYVFPAVADRFEYIEYYFIPSTFQLSTGTPTAGKARRISNTFKSSGEGKISAQELEKMLIEQFKKQSNNTSKAKDEGSRSIELHLETLRKYIP